MSMLDIKYIVYYGRSRKDLKEATLSLTNVHINEDDRVSGSIGLTGLENFYQVNKKTSHHDLFNLINLVFKGFRQILRSYQAANPEIKFYIKYDADVREITVEDLFYVDDCIPEE